MPKHTETQTHRQMQTQMMPLSALSKTSLLAAQHAYKVQALSEADMNLALLKRSEKLTLQDRAFAAPILEAICTKLSDLTAQSFLSALQNNADLPKYQAHKLMSALEDLVLPILPSSPIITDRDILELLQSRAAIKFKSILSAQDSMTTILSDRHDDTPIISHHDGAALSYFAANDSEIEAGHRLETGNDKADDDINSSDIMPDYQMASQRGWAKFAAENVQNSYQSANFDHSDLPFGLICKLIKLGMLKLKGKLEQRAGLDGIAIRALMSQSQQRLILSFYDAYGHERMWSDEDLARYIHACGMLQDFGTSQDIGAPNTVPNTVLGRDLILRAAGQGAVRLAAHILSAICADNSEKIYIILKDANPMGLKTLCKAARLQQQDYTFLMSAISIWAAHGYIDRPLHRLQMQEHIHAELQQNFTQSEYEISGDLMQDYNQLLDRGQLLQLV